MMTIISFPDFSRAGKNKNVTSRYDVSGLGGQSEAEATAKNRRLCITFTIESYQ